MRDLLVVGALLLTPLGAGACVGVIVGSWLDLRDVKRGLL